MRKTILPFLFLFLTTLPVFAQSPTIYSKVSFKLNPNLTVAELEALGIAVDHVHKNGENSVDMVLNEKEIELLDQSDIPYKILVPDLSARYLEWVIQMENASVDMTCGLDHFDEGEMGSYHSYEDMQRHIEMMEEEFPDLVKITAIGKSVEDRTVFSVKISDQVTVDESAEEGVVYYDALTHAREPMGLESLLYYMWWLLENYGTDAEATYLIDNREMFFVPVVNPDGYVYNQTTNPNGGGFWRKNRRDNGNGCFGIDLNRNYAEEWGNTVGASADPCSDNYYGAAPFSEPETANVRDFVAQINPVIAFSCHTYSDVFLCPNAHDNELPEYDIYADFSSEFIPSNYRGYGTWQMMIGYFGSGTTQDYLHSEGIYAWTPEIGHKFWENPVDICSRIEEMLEPLQYLSWVAGDYVTINSYTIKNEEQIWNGDELEIVLTLRNKGLSTTTKEVKIWASSPLTALEPLVSEIVINDLVPRTKANTTTQPLRFKIAADALTLGQEIPIDIRITQDGTVSTDKRLRLYAGAREELFTEDGESGMDLWVSTGTSDWGITDMDDYGGQNCIADSPLGNFATNESKILTTAVPFDLSNATKPYLEFDAKWSLDVDGDRVFVEISTDELNWEYLGGNYSYLDSDNVPFYSYNQHWINERIDLSKYIGASKVFIRFTLESDFVVRADGFYFDNLKVVDYTEGFDVGLPSLSESKNLSLFPNPAKGQAHVSFELDRNEKVVWTLTDMTGKKVDQKIQNFRVGENIFSINFPNSGVYFLQITIGEEQEVLRLVNL